MPTSGYYAEENSLNDWASMISIVIPTWNEAPLIEGAVTHALTITKDVIVVDGGSSDTTVSQARAAGARVLKSRKGRGIQLHTGACQAQGELLLFLHADVRLPECAHQVLVKTMADPTIVGGNFMIRFYPETRFSRVLAWSNDWRRHLTHRYYGDSGIFVRREVYQRLEGFAPVPLMEDYQFSRRLEKSGRTAYLREPYVVASTRRFQDRPLPTLLRWVTIQSLYWLGISPWLLARMYPDVRRQDNLDFLQSAEQILTKQQETS